MNTWRTWWVVFLMFGSLCWGPFVDAQQKTGAHPSIEILRIGPVDLRETREPVLDGNKFDIFGRAPTQDDNGIFHALARPLGDRMWTLAASARPTPGGVFRLLGLSFPAAGKYELVVGYFDKALDSATTVSDANLEELSRSLSARVTVTIGVAPPVHPKSSSTTAQEAFPTLTIVEIGGRLPGSVVVKLPTEVVVRSESFDQDPKIYLALLAPHTNRVWIYGPASPRRAPHEYVVPALSLTVPGDLQQTRFEVIAFSTQHTVTPGVTDVHRFRALVEHSSVPLEFVVGELEIKADSPRIASVGITRIGDSQISNGRLEAKAQLRAQNDKIVPLVRSGDSVEVGNFSGIPQGARIWILTRPHGSLLWLVQGVAQATSLPSLFSSIRPNAGANSRGTVSVKLQPVAPAQPDPIAPLVLAAVQFVGPSGESHASTAGEHDVLAVVALDTLPRMWIAPSFLAASSIVSLSEIVRVRVIKESPKDPQDLKIAIMRIGQNRVSAGMDQGQYRLLAGDTIELSVRDYERKAPQQLQPSMQVYLATRRADAEKWQLHEVIGSRKTYLASGIHFKHDGSDGNTVFEILAIVTEGALASSEHELGTQELKERALAISDRVLASKESDDERMTEASFGNFISQGMDMWPILLLVAAIGLLTVAVWAARRFPRIIRRGAEPVSRWLDRYDEVFKPHGPVDSAEVAVGAILLGTLLYTIIAVYLPFFAETISETLNFTPQRGFGLAVLIVLSTAFTGVLIHMFSRSEHAALRRLLPGVVLLSLSLLIIFQTSLFRRVMPSDSFLWAAFALIPVVEASGIYFATKFLWNFLGFALYLAFRMPLLLLLVLAISSEGDCLIKETTRGTPQEPNHE
jgi:hypothetical protein